MSPSRIVSLLSEFDREATTTRPHLERLPSNRFEWRPHPKSSSAGQLAAHIVDCLRWVAPIFSADEFTVTPDSFRPLAVTSAAAVLQAFDDEVARARAAMIGATDTDASQPWQLKMRGKVWFEKPRELAFRDMALNHLVHHRGQFSVYLRLLDVPVPGSYGPTADGA